MGVEVQLVVSPSRLISEKIIVPGDKSISHRALILGSIATGKTHITGFLPGKDNEATLNCMLALGASIKRISNTELLIDGVGKNGLKAPSAPLDCANSGTAMRLLAGLLAGQLFDSTLIGDESLMSRPMGRVTDPLAFMGSLIATAEGGTAPLFIQGMHCLKGIAYDLPVASAQVKSCLLIAGLYADSVTSVVEPSVTRDHTEKMLRAMQYPVKTDGSTISIDGGGELVGCDLEIPGDLSSAAFFMVASALANSGEVTIKSVGINETRDGVIRILKLMGASIVFENKQFFGEEPVVDLTVKPSKLQGITIPEEWVSLAIDELPVLMVAAACASGKTILRGARELRFKESDRIKAMVIGLQKLGINVEEYEDGVAIEGGEILGGEVDAIGDHRVAMSFAIAGIIAKSSIYINDCANIKTSFPDFVSLMSFVGVEIEVVV